jgi:short subunit dehydrogenase-like uncharacterized protein
VPSDCLAAHLKRRLPNATDLKLYLSLGANMSHGTAKTMIEAIAAGTRIRRNSRLFAATAASSPAPERRKGRVTLARARRPRSRSAGATSPPRIIRPKFPTSRFSSRRCRRSAA